MACSSKESALDHLKTLDTAARKRYEEKIDLIGGEDPYTMDSDSFSSDPIAFPNVTYPDIVNYLISSPSPYTLEKLKAYKGLEAYNQFVSGWVRDVRTAILEKNMHLVMGKVLHSQRLRSKPLRPWFVAEHSGKVLCAHCDCMAGLGESCTHVSALLFFVDTAVRIWDTRTVTQEPAYWKIPTSGGDQGIAYLPLTKIDFTSAKSRKRNLDSSIDSNPDTTPTSQRTAHVIPEPSDAEMSAFFNALAGTKAAILSITPGYTQPFRPLSSQGVYPPNLLDLYDTSNCALSYSELLKKCQELHVGVTQEQADCVEAQTREQAACKQWFVFRSGCITASKIKQACRTNPHQPSWSLVQSVCYPAANKFSTAATKWGCSHEDNACLDYVQKMTFDQAWDIAKRKTPWCWKCGANLTLAEGEWNDKYCMTCGTYRKPMYAYNPPINPENWYG